MDLFLDEDADLDGLESVFKDYLDGLVDDFCAELATAWAAAIKDYAPYDTGALSNTAQAQGDKVVLQHYWKYVYYGHRVVARRKGGGIVGVTDAQGNVKMVPPNPYMEEAWEDPRVQAVLRRYEHILTAEFPLKKVS
jgi:hypothetical protein